ALKTGTAYTSRQLDSVTALLNALAVLAPVAWKLLLLKSFGRCSPKAPATVALTALEIEIVRAMERIKLPRDPSLQDAMNAVAAMGGHLRRNGAPGWQTLARGLEDLTRYKRAWKAARKRCDQS
ncbi:MAG: hypothetical protein ACI9MR_000054, partial [Myxococcota bacterium]